MNPFHPHPKLKTYFREISLFYRSIIFPKAVFTKTLCAFLHLYASIDIADLWLQGNHIFLKGISDTIRKEGGAHLDAEN